MGEGSDRPSTRFPSTVTHTSSSVEHTMVPFPVPLLYMKKKICRGGVQLQGSGRVSFEAPYMQFRNDSLIYGNTIKCEALWSLVGLLLLKLDTRCW